MEKKFSTSWKASKQPRKQRKYAANAPLHIRKKMMNVHLSKDLRKKYGTRSIRLRKGDTVKVVRGSFFGKEGKVITIMLKKTQVEIEGIQRKKADGSKVNVRVQPSNLQIIEINLEDSKRDKNIRGTQTKTEEPKSKSKKQEIKNAP